MQKSAAVIGKRSVDVIFAFQCIKSQIPPANHRGEKWMVVLYKIGQINSAAIWKKIYFLSLGIKKTSGDKISGVPLKKEESANRYE